MSWPTALGIIVGCSIILMTIIVVSIVCLFPDIVNGVKWTPYFKDHRSINEIEDDSRRPFASILGLPYIGVVGEVMGEEDGRDVRRNKMV